MKRFTNKVALVTGAARGQGRSHALHLAEEGADLIAIDICRNVEGVDYDMATSEELQKTQKLAAEHGVRVIAHEVDTRDGQALTEAVDEAVAQLGGLNIVVANAGVATVGALLDTSQRQWDAIIGVNLTGSWNTLRASVPHLRTAGGGSIVMISSAAGLVGLPVFSAYTASKHGIVGLTRSLSNELAQENIRVNAVCPTGVKGTAMSKALDAQAPAAFKDLTERAQSSFANSMSVLEIDPSDVSDSVLFLASDDARFVTGITLSVDAGLVNL